MLFDVHIIALRCSGFGNESIDDIYVNKTSK